MHPIYVDAKLDLLLERFVPVRPELLWKAWTTPQVLMKWFCPVPWRTTECEMDLWPGGVFRTVMQSPEGEKFPNMGCFLEIVENKRLAWTDALLPGFRPAAKVESGANLTFTAIVLFEAFENGTNYRVIARHKDEIDRQKHVDMGFHQGWGIALDQLVKEVSKKQNLL